MSNNASSHERIHALDSLRAIMMMLGLVLHAALTYAFTEFGGAWPIKDSTSTSNIMDWVSFWIHLFRMPVFFVVAVFFGALLFYKRGAKKMIKNRLERILYPFFVFLLLLAPLVNFSFAFTWTTFDSNTGWKTVNNMLPQFSSYIAHTAFHLWFLYYLLLITFTSFVIGVLLHKMPKARKNILNIFNPIVQYPFLKLFVFSSLIFMMLYLMKTKWVATSVSFIPDLKTFLFYSFFYIFGWILYKSKQPLEQLKQYDWLFAILGLCLFTIKFFISSSLSSEAIMAFNAVIVWLFTFGIMGLFIRYGSKHSVRMRYVSDASYWFYLIHLPLTAFLPGLIAAWEIPAIGKFLIVFSITAAICWSTYHYLVRPTFIGQFLNGRKYSIKTRLNKPGETLEKAA